MLFNFIENQTNWYVDKSKEIQRLRLQIELETPAGTLKDLKTKLNKLRTAKAIIIMSTVINDAFTNAPNFKLLQVSQSLNALLDLQIDHVKTKIENLQILHKGTLSMEQGAVQGVFHEGGYTKPNHWQSVSDLQRELREESIIQRQKTEYPKMYKKGYWREKDILGNMGGA